MHGPIYIKKQSDFNAVFFGGLSRTRKNVVMNAMRYLKAQWFSFYWERYND
jgi:hypothetical protein